VGTFSFVTLILRDPPAQKRASHTGTRANVSNSAWLSVELADSSCWIGVGRAYRTV